jgi:excisionase family DNA binding protein
MKEKRLEVSIVAMRLNVSTATVYRLLSCGKLRGGKMGVSRCVRVMENSVKEFEARRSCCE